MRNVKFIFSLVIAATLIFSAATCAAADIWIEHWDSQDVDVYIKEDTVKDATPPSGHDYRVVTVSVKLVKNGQLEEILLYKFRQIQRKAWKYKTGEDPEGVVVQDTSVNIPARNKIFEFSIKKLGWSYEIRDGYYY